LSLFYALDMLRSIVFLKVLQKDILSYFVENFMAHLLGKQPGLHVEKKNSYIQIRMESELMTHPLYQRIQLKFISRR
jgi:hypothetical protein